MNFEYIVISNISSSLIRKLDTSQIKTQNINQIQEEEEEI